MANINKTHGVIGILTGGGDVPGLNPAIRAVTIRALREGYRVIGIRRGWAGLIDIVRDAGADDTLSYAVRMYQEGVKVVAIPKTMDNDVPGTDYCIGFSTCVTRTIELANSLRTVAGSHERLMVLEVFGRYAGFTSMLPTMAGAAHRCVIPEFKFNIERLVELLMHARNHNPSRHFA